jgi:S1-C subfamily serine protease
MWRRLGFLAVLTMGALASTASAQEDLNDLIEKMTKEAARKAGPSIVQIETRGGADMVVAGPKGQVIRKALGPTTGVVVDGDGYIISSAFNFLNNPPIILVRVAGQQGDPLVATRVATDKSRMLTLLKVDAKGLPTQSYVPKKEIKEGQWSIALGRALDAKMDKTPSICVGVISALGRVWGKAIQSDAKISPINYGGPLVDIQGRIQGIIIPASPNGEDVTAGIEWYDSGIGFAVPMEDVIAVLPRLKLGKDLQKGILGVAMKSPDKFSVLPEIGTVLKASPAERAGLKPGDTIVEVEGKSVVNMAQVQHILGVKYEGDKIALKYKRGKDTVEVKSLELVGKDIVIAQPFLGILPMRDDPKLGVEIRHVFAKSPAEQAGLKAGDRIVKFGTDEKALVEFTGEKRGRNQFVDWLNTLSPGADVKLTVKRKGGDKTDTVSATLGNLPGSLPGAPATIPDKLPEEATFKKALAALELNNPNIKPPKILEQKPPMPDTGLLELNTPDGEHKYWLWVYPEYDPNIAHAMVVWLHPPGKNTKEDLDGWADLWDEYCRKHHIILVMPVEKQDGWLPGYSDYVVAAARETMKTYTIDNQRVIANGMGAGGQMALHLAFNHRDVFKGACAVGATASQIKDNVANQRLSFFLVGGSLDPIVKSIAESRIRLAERRYPAFYREMPERGREYLTDKVIQEAVRWLDSLDQQ